MATPNQLEGQLREYSAAVAATLKNVRHRAGNWPIYAAATGSALAMATSASASVVYCGPSTNYCAPGTGFVPPPANASTAGIQINLDGMAGDLVLIQGTQGSATYGPFQGFVMRAGSNVKVFSANPISVRNFGVGSLIGPPPPTGGASVLRIASQSAPGYGQFTAGVAGVAGFEILGPTNEFGWIRIQFANNASGYPQELNVLDWAYQTDGSPIASGVVPEPSAPEPSTAALSLLAMGAAGVMAWKRRRKAATTPA